MASERDHMKWNAVITSSYKLCHSTLILWHLRETWDEMKQHRHSINISLRDIWNKTHSYWVNDIYIYIHIYMTIYIIIIIYIYIIFYYCGASKTKKDMKCTVILLVLLQHLRLWKRHEMKVWNTQCIHSYHSILLVLLLLVL